MGKEIDCIEPEVDGESYTYTNGRSVAKPAAVNAKSSCFVSLFGASLLSQSIGLSVAFFAGAVVLMTAGLSTPVVIDNYVKSQVDNLVVIDSVDAPGYDTWSNGNGSFASYYLFNYTNPFEIVNSGAKPIVTELGPYTYQLKEHKFEVTFDAEADTIEFYLQRYFLFQPEKSCNAYANNEAACAEEDKLYHDQTVTTINYALQLLVYQGEKASIDFMGFPLPLISFLGPIFTHISYNPFDPETFRSPPALGGTCHIYDQILVDDNTTVLGTVDDCGSVFVQRPISEILWGYEAPELIAVNRTINALKSNPALAALLEGVGDFDTRFPGLQNNMTSKEIARANGINVVGMGKSRKQELQYYSKWHGYSTLEVNSVLNLTSGGFNKRSPWGTAEANKVEGYAGYFFPPDLAPESDLRIWVPSVGRHFDVVNDGGTTLEVEGIRLLNYSIPRSSFANSTNNPYNGEAYYANGANGLINITALSFDAPIFMSKPHFLDCDESVADAIEGLPPPLASRDDTVIGIEPITGVNMFSRQRLQTNMKLAPVLSLGWWEDINQEAYMPVFWLDLNGIVSTKQATAFKDSIYFAQDIGETAWYAGVGLSVPTFCACAFFAFRAFSYKNKRAGYLLTDQQTLDAPLTSSDGQSPLSDDCSVGVSPRGSFSDNQMRSVSRDVTMV
jgi:lysosome membrane protein 2